MRRILFLALTAFGATTLAAEPPHADQVPGLPIKPVQTQAREIPNPKPASEAPATTQSKSPADKAPANAAPLVAPAPATPAAAAKAAMPSASVDELMQLRNSVVSRQQDLQPEIKPAPPVVSIAPGKTEIIPIAIGHMNRFRTPFRDVRIQTTIADCTAQGTNACASIQKEGGTFYVATPSNVDVSMFVMDKSDPDHAVSLLLRPYASLSPADVKVEIPGFELKPVAPTSSSASAESSQPYVSSIKTLFRAIANGQIPSGYALKPVKSGTPFPRCTLSDLDFTPAQELSGSTITTYIARLRNRSRFPVEVDESSCASPRVLAVAAWPLTRLAPGDQTELYIAVRNPDLVRDTPERPSVIDTAH